MDNRTSFPRIDCPKRTDLDFRNRTIQAHHREFSPLEKLPIDMVEDFIIADDLHLLHLGIMKKSLLMWKDGLYKFPYKWTKNDIAKLNKMLANVNNDMPVDIHRSVRSIDCFKFWKGSELRTFLLYIGAVVLKHVLRTEEYDHFIWLFCAVTLCSTDHYFNKNRERMSSLARELFNDYIEKFIDLYGIEYVSSNVHNLTHIVDDVLKFGNLTKIGSYPFENCLAALKLRLRNCNRPLEQISRRIAELNLDYRDSINFEQNNEPILKYPMVALIDELESVVYSQIFFRDHFFLSSRNFGDKWFLTDDSKVIEFQFAMKHQDEYLLYGNYVKNLDNFFTQPFSSKIIYIFSGKYEKSESKYFQIKNVMAKLICMRNSDNYIYMPLLHTL